MRSLLGLQGEIKCVACCLQDWEVGDSLKNLKTVERALRGVEDTRTHELAQFHVYART